MTITASGRHGRRPPCYLGSDPTLRHDKEPVVVAARGHARILASGPLNRREPGSPGARRVVREHPPCLVAGYR